MRIFLWGLLGFILGTVAGYCAVFFGWVVLSNFVSIADMSGGTSMGVAFGLAPMVALVTGLIAAIVFAKRAAS